MDQRAAGRARARERAPPQGAGLSGRRLGASFSPRRARARGLEWKAAFRRLLELDLSPLRLSAYWDEVDGPSGYDDLDWQVAEADRAGREVVVTAGMKAMGWPEFALPERLSPAVRPGGDVSTGGDQALREAVTGLVEETVRRYRGTGAVIAWQVENEPLNRSGPRRWWIAPELVRDEIAAARRADPDRPVVLNVFAAFNRQLDVASSRHGVCRLLGLDAHRPEAEALSLLQHGDVLGLDVYRSIGYRALRGSGRRFSVAKGWRENARRWRERAAAAGVEAWIVEAQAEPWEPDLGPDEPPTSCSPDMVTETVRELRGAGYGTVLLWGVEHWLAREAAGDDSWLRAVDALGNS